MNDFILNIGNLLNIFEFYLKIYVEIARGNKFLILNIITDIFRHLYRCLYLGLSTI